MESILLKFSLTPAPLTKVMWIWMVLIWSLVLLGALASIRSQAFSRRQRLLWSLVVVGVPVLGLLAYLPTSLFKVGSGLGASLLPQMPGGQRR